MQKRKREVFSNSQSLYLAAEFNLSLRILKRERDRHFLCSFGSILEVLYLYFTDSGKMAWMPFSTASDMDVTLP